MKQLINTAFLFFMIAPCAKAQVNSLERVAPETVGIPSQAITELLDSLTSLPQTDIHSVMVLRHGKVVAEMFPEPFAAEYRHTVYSCSKTFVAAAIGIAVSENRVRLEDRVAPFFADALPDSISHHLAAMRVRDLLTMSSGIEPDWELRNLHQDWARQWLSKPVADPGQTFMYDSMCSYLLSAIVQKVTGMTLLDYLKVRVFNELGITEVAWEISPEGYNTGGWGLYIQTESLAKFGQLLLNKGNWYGRQLIPASWVEAMMTKQIETGEYGYGYQMWPCEYPTAARLDGAYGQYVMVIPEKDMVVVITECTAIDGIRQRRLVWNILMPRVGTVAQESTMRKSAKAYVLPYPKGKRKGSCRFLGRSFSLSPNDLGWQSIRITNGLGGLTLEICDKDGIRIPVSLGYHSWEKTVTDAKPVYSIMAEGRFKGIDGPFVIAASYGWERKDCLNIKLHYVNWMTAVDIKLHPDHGDGMAMEAIVNHTKK